MVCHIGFTASPASFPDPRPRPRLPYPPPLSAPFLPLLSIADPPPSFHLPPPTAYPSLPTSAKSSMLLIQLDNPSELARRIARNNCLVDYAHVWPDTPYRSRHHAISLSVTQSHTALYSSKQHYTALCGIIRHHGASCGILGHDTASYDTAAPHTGSVITHDMIWHHAVA